MQDQALLVVSFGTTHPDTREKNIVAVENTLQQAFPKRKFFHAYTSNVVRARIKQKEKIEIPGVEEALQEIAAQGIKDLLVQPTHLIQGHEFEDVQAGLTLAKEHFDKVKLGLPLLADAADLEQVVAAIASHALQNLDEHQALLLMGHGSSHRMDATYQQLEASFHRAGHAQVFVRTVEGEHGLGSVLPLLQEKKIQHVCLLPLMLVAGEHAQNDLAGDSPDSWKHILSQHGITIDIRLQGLGELPEIRQMYVEHARQAKEI